jgi:hypothetical protein
VHKAEQSEVPAFTTLYVSLQTGSAGGAVTSGLGDTDTTGAGADATYLAVPSEHPEVVHPAVSVG